MDIGAWLGNLGLSRYEAAFRENSIDVDILAELTDNDLLQLGVTLGDRKRLLKAIANLPNEPVPPAPTPRVHSAPDAERRPITVMFCDLVGSTSLAAKLDAEDWRDLVGAYLDEASKSVTDFGGHVLKKLGDGLMALFGYPKAQENDAERAARAGLAILRGLDGLNARNAGKGLPPLAARIGLESGPVVVDETGEVFGDAPNIAARVQAAAEPGTLLVTATVQRQIAGLFVAEDKGPHELKGVTGKTILYRLVRASGGGRRMGTRSLTPLIGREEDLALLARRWERVRGGEGQFIQVVGEPGIGKSRLIEEFRSRLAETPHSWVEWTASSLLQNTPLHPIVEWGRQRFGGAEIAGEKRLSELENALTQVKLDPTEHAPLLAPLLDTPVSEERAPKLAPDEFRRRQLAALVAWLLAGSRQQPVVLAFEDLHWADPTTLDLMKALADRGAQTPLLIVATTRPEFRAPWATRSHHGVISLFPLDRTQIHKMIAAIAERHALTEDVVEGLSDRTGGVPLFVEELTRLLLEGGVQAIPPTLQQSLAARLDRLGEAREVAQIGAVLGREFSYELLKSVAGFPETTIQAALEKLTDADLLFVEGMAPNSSYRFKHALIQDAAYENLLKSRRRALHRKAAETLRDAFPDQTAAQPEVLAHHFALAGMNEEAIDYWGKAGDQALRRSAFPEAISHLGKAIEMADKEETKKPAGHGEARAALQRNLATATMWSKGFSAPETETALGKLREIAHDAASGEDRYAIQNGIWVSQLFKGEFRAAVETAIAHFEEARRLGDAIGMMLVAHWVGTSKFHLGHWAEARDWLERTMGEIARGGPERMALAHERTSAASYLAFSMWMLGEIDCSLQLVREAVDAANETRHAPSIAVAHGARMVFDRMRGDAASALRASMVCAESSQRAGMVQYEEFGEMGTRLAKASLSCSEAYIADARRSVGAYIQTGHRFLAPFFLGCLADAEMASGHDESALAAIGDALALAAETGEQFFDVFVLSLRGDILLKLYPDDPAPAEQAYLEAIAVAQNQGARSFELQVALKLSKLYHSIGRAAEIHNILAAALEGFEPTPEMPEIREAQALLAEYDEVNTGRSLREQRGKLYANYARAALQAKGLTSKDAEIAFQRARALVPTSEISKEALGELIARLLRHLMRAELVEAREVAVYSLRGLDSSGDTSSALPIRCYLAMANLFLGELHEACVDFEKVLADAVSDDGAKPFQQLAGDPVPRSKAFLAVTTWLLGDVGRASTLLEEATSEARSSNPVTYIAVLQTQCLLENLRGHSAAALEAADTLITLAGEKGMVTFRHLGQMRRAVAWGRLYDPALGARELREAVAAYEADGGRVGVPLHYADLAELNVLAGDPAQALVDIDRGLAEAAETENHMGDALLHLRRGGALTQLHDAAAAEASYRKAIDIAHVQGARTFELQAGLALAKLLQSNSRLIETHEVLAAALDDFPATTELPAYIEAQTLLAGQNVERA
jgi:class 3 adenylate cyclase